MPVPRPAPEPAPAAAGSDAANTRGWLIGACVLAVVMIGWLAWSWPDGSHAAPVAQEQPAPAPARVAQPAPPAPAVVTTTPPPQPQTAEPADKPASPAVPLVSTWDDLLRGSNR